MFLESVTIPDK